MNKTRRPLENIARVHVVENSMEIVDVNKGAESGKTKKEVWLQLNTYKK